MQEIGRRRAALSRFRSMCRATGRQGDRETRRQGDREIRRGGDGETQGADRDYSWLPFSVSPSLGALNRGELGHYAPRRCCQPKLTAPKTKSAKPSGPAGSRKDHARPMPIARSGSRRPRAAIASARPSAAISPNPTSDQTIAQPKPKPTSSEARGRKPRASRASPPDLEKIGRAHV